MRRRLLGPLCFGGCTSCGGAGAASAAVAFPFV